RLLPRQARVVAVLREAGAAGPRARAQADRARRPRPDGARGRRVVGMPLLVEYGAWVWKVSALACALVGLLVADALRGRAERARMTRALSKRMADVSAPVLA